DVEDADFEWLVLVGISQKTDDFLLLTGIEGAPEYLAARLFDFRNQRGKLVAVAAPRKDREAFGREFLRDLGADVVAGANDRRRLVSVRQDLSPREECVLLAAGCPQRRR